MIFFIFLSSGIESGVPQQAAHVSTMNVDFDAVFGTEGANNDVKPAAGGKKINKKKSPLKELT